MITTDNTKTLENALDDVNRLVDLVAALNLFIIHSDQKYHDLALGNYLSLPGYLFESIEKSEETILAELDKGE
jgi:hypothetical protein